MGISRSLLLSTAKRLFHALGIDVSFAKTMPTEQNILRKLFQLSDLEYVLDVGANTGQYGLLARRCGFLGPIVSYEPLSKAHQALVARAASDRLWIVADRVALGARTSHGNMNIAANSVSSSLLDMHARHLEAAPHSAYSGTEEVTIAALDDCIDQYITEAKHGLLKIDTQGYEIEVLRGAHRSLSDKIDAVQTELSLVELYEGQALILDVCNFLKQYGFNLRYIIPGLKDPENGSLLQLDGIFTKN